MCLIMPILVQALKYFKIILLADDERYTKPYKTYFGVDTIEKSWNNIIKESKYCSKVIEAEFIEPLVMTKKDHEDCRNSVKCWICKRVHE